MSVNFVIPSVFVAIDKMTAPMRAMEGAFKSFGNKAESSIARANRTFYNLGNSADRAYSALSPFRHLNNTLGLLGITAGVAGLTQVFKKFVTEASKIENATASFQGILGGADKARKLVGDLNKLGAATPFDFGDLSQAAQVMLGFGAATQENVIDKLRMVGDLAQGNAERLSGITLAFSQIQAAGKASMQDVNQLINNGVPILGQLAKQWKMTVGAAREAVSKGKASAAEIEKAFLNMTSKGGMFFNGMAIASQTFSGKMSTLTDSINMAFAEIGNAALPIISEYVTKVNRVAVRIADWADANKDLIKLKIQSWIEGFMNVLGWLSKNFNTIIKAVKIYGGVLLGLKALSLLAAGAQFSLAVATFAYKVGLFLFNKEARLAMLAQMKLNMAMLASPLTWIVLGIVALIVAIAVLVSKVEGWGKQWDAIVKWMKAIFNSYVLWIKLQFQLVLLGFMTMVDGMVLAYKKAQNILGILSDQQFARDKARIQEEQKMRVDGIRKTAAELAAASKEVMAGPGWHLKWKTDEAAKANSVPGGGAKDTSLNALLSGSAQGTEMYSLPQVDRHQAEREATGKTITSSIKQQLEILIKDETGRARVTKNTLAIPIKFTSTTGVFDHQ